MSSEEDRPQASRPGEDAGGLASYEALLRSVESALSDGEVERVAALGAEWLGRLGSPEVRRFAEAALPMLPRFTAFLERIRPAVEAGLLEQLADLTLLSSTVLDAVTPGQAERLAREAEGLLTLLNAVMVEEPAVVWRSGMRRVLGTWEQAGASPRAVGLRELLRARRDPRVQHMLRTLLALVDDQEPRSRRA